MAKKKSPAYKLRMSSRGPPVPPVTSSEHRDASSYITWKRFAVVFVVGFILAIIPDIIELKNLMVQEESSLGSSVNITVHLTREEWYKMDVTKLPTSLQDKYVPFTEDEDTRQFVRNSTIKSKMFFREMFHTIIRKILSPFIAKTSINGLLGRSKMFLFSDEQFTELVGEEKGWHSGFHLDIGAGDGTITKGMAFHFDQTWVTEISKPMEWELRRKGFGISDVNHWHKHHHLYDMVTCLNILDRCDKPKTMLENIRKVLTPGGLVVISLVLPLDPYVEFEKPDNEPAERLDIHGTTFEEQLESFVYDVLKPLSYQLVRFTKLPYLCEGTLQKPFFQVPDAVFVLKVM